MTPDSNWRPSPIDVLAVGAVLALIAALAPPPWYQTDRETYEQVGREILVADCSSLHCFRILVPAIVEHLPGPSLLKWKTYAVIANTIAAVAVGRVAVVFGASAWAARLTIWERASARLLADLEIFVVYALAKGE